MTSSTPTLTGLRPRARLLITALAALSIVFSQLAGFATQPAAADDFTYNVTFQFSLGGAVDTVVVSGAADQGGNNIAVPGYDWDGDPSGLFHVSCSAEPLVGTTATVTASNDHFDVGDVVTITYADIDRNIEGSQGQGGSCTDGTFQQNPQPAGTVTLTEQCDPDGVRYQVSNTGDGTIYWQLTDTDDTILDSGTIDEDGTAVDEVHTLNQGDTYDLTLEAFTGTDATGTSLATTTETGTIDCATPQPDLSIVKSASTETIARGGDFSYTIDVDNDGDATSEQLAVRDEVPAPFVLDAFRVIPDSGSQTSAYCTSQENQIHCFVGRLGAGESFTLEIDVSVPDDAACDAVTNTGILYQDLLSGDYGSDQPFESGFADQALSELAEDTARVVVTGCGSPPPPPSFDPDIDIVKSAVSADVDFTFVDGALTVALDAGQSTEVTYEYVITNEGDESLDTLGLDDDLIGDLTDEFVTAVDDAYGTTFPVAGEVTVTATYTTTEADFLAGSVTNIATVSGTGVTSNSDVEAQDDETVQINEVQGEFIGTPDISIVKSAIDGVEPDGDDLSVTLGDDEVRPITYEYVITNTGEDDLTDLSLVDDKIGDLSEALQGALGSAVLPVDASVTVTAVHDVDLDDFTDGSLVNIATVEGTGVDSGEAVSDRDDERVVVIEVQGVTVVRDVSSTTEALPRTGLDTPGLTGLGLLLAVVGAGVLLADRRREQGDAS